jgi:lipopolysaccharide cholinephosphotransferase
METQLRQLQLTQLEILKIFDSFCRKHELKYSLYAGSLLGAVRHKGFIPWDDDLDVCMDRNDYDRFLSLWETDPVNGYVLQNKDNSQYFDQSFTKLRKDHTTYLEKQWQVGSHHTGIFLDIFPIDRLPEGSVSQKLFHWNCMVYQLLCREFVPKQENFLIRTGSAAILACIPKFCRASVRKRLLRRITRSRDRRDLPAIAIETLGSLRKPFAADMLDHYVRLPFEDSEFMCFAGWDDHLRRKFGDYMQLPPEQERTWKHHPIIIDFHHNYEDIPR